MPTPAEGLETPSRPLLAIRRGTKGLFPARIVPLCVPVRAPFPLHASVSPFEAGAKLWPPPGCPARPRLCPSPTWWPGWGLGGTWQGVVPVPVPVIPPSLWGFIPAPRRCRRDGWTRTTRW